MNDEYRVLNNLSPSTLINLRKNRTMTRIAIIGAGAIGSVVGAFLSRAGVDVTLIGRPEHVSAIRQSGLRVEGRAGAFSARIAAAEALEFKPDFAFLTVKTQDVLPALRANLKFLKDSPLVTFQNGVRSDGLVASLLPKSQIISVVVNISASYLTPGTVTVVYPGTLVIGRPFGEPDGHLESLAALLAHAAPTTISENIQGVHWLKLLFNLNNAFPALLNIGLHKLYTYAYVRDLAARVIREGLQTVRKAGIQLESLPEVSVRLFQVLGMLPAPLAGLLIASRARRIESQWPLLGSTLQSPRRGRPTEIDYLNGEIVRLGAEVGSPTPLNAVLVELVHEVERSGEFLMIEGLQSMVEAAVMAETDKSTTDDLLGKSHK
jgi:2-dehydropantoate 2-reductase